MENQLLPVSFEFDFCILNSNICYVNRFRVYVLCFIFDGFIFDTRSCEDPLFWFVCEDIGFNYFDIKLDIHLICFG